MEGHAAEPRRRGKRKSESIDRTPTPAQLLAQARATQVRQQLEPQPPACGGNICLIPEVVSNTMCLPETGFSQLTMDDAQHTPWQCNVMQSLVSAEACILRKLLRCCTQAPARCSLQSLYA